MVGHVAELLDPVQLRTLVAIADCGGFGRAATALHMSQPTVSQHVRLLERRLGQALMIKDGRKAKFTAAGERLLNEARRILAVHDDAMHRLNASHVGSLLIGSAETAAEQVLPDLLQTVRAAFPDQPVQFRIDRSTQILEEVEKGTLDLAIVLGFDLDTRGAMVGTLPLTWFSAPGWEFPDDDRPVPLVAYTEPCGMRQRALHELAARGYTVEIVAESSTLDGVIAAARAGLGLAVLPSAGRTPRGLRVQRTLPDLGDIGIHLAARRGIGVEIESAAFDALELFFSGQRRIEAIPA